MGTSRYNIFKDFYETKEEIIGNSGGLFSDENLRLIKALEAFFQSGIWARNETEKLMFYRAKSGLTSAQLANLMNINPNTYRATLSRLSQRLRDLLFGGRMLNAVCLSSDTELINKTLNTVDFLLLRFDFYSEMPAFLVTKLEDYCTTAKNEDYSEEEVFNALNFLSRFSLVSIDGNLKGLNPAALKYVIKQLAGINYTEEMVYYKRLQALASRPVKVTSKGIEAIKQGKGGNEQGA